MMISRITFSKYSVRQGNAGRMVDRESTIIRNSKYRMTTAHSVDINSQRKKRYFKPVTV